MAEVYLGVGSTEISQASEGLQLNSTAATLEYIRAWLDRLEIRLVEHERRAAAALHPLRPEPDPPDGPPLYAVAQPPYQPFQPPSVPYKLHRNPWSMPHVSSNSAPPTPPAPMSESYHRYLSLTPEPDDPYYYYQPSGELYPPMYNGRGGDHPKNPYNNLDDYSPYIDSWQPEDHLSRSRPPPDRTLHPPSWLPSYSSSATAAVRQPPQLREPSSCFEMPQYQVPNSTPTYIASVISPTATTQSHSCHGQPVAVLQPLPCPASHCRSAATLPAAAPPPSSLPADNIPTMVLGEDVSAGIVPNNATHNVGATLDVPNDKVLEEILKNDEESPQVLVEAMTGKNMVYDDKNQPQVSTLLPLLKRGIGSLPIRKEVMEILFQEGFIMFRWISSGEYIQTSGQAGRRGIDEWRHLTIRCAFDPGGESSPKLLFASLFVVSWFPP